MLLGIVGKANVGKSTFFKALTMAEVLIANYPFATIDPTKGFGFVRISCVDTFFGVQCNPRTGYCVNHQRFVPVEVMDVAGLVPGAHLGKGLGLSFLDDLRQADAFIHVVDMAGSTNERGEPIGLGGYDPANDIRFLEYELDMWCVGILKKGWERFARLVHQEKGDIVLSVAKQMSGLNITESHVKTAVAALKMSDDILAWTDADLFRLAQHLRRMTKPMLIAANKMDLPSAKENLDRVRKEFPHLLVVPCAADLELSLKSAAKAGLISYIPGDSFFAITGNPSDAQRRALGFMQDFLGRVGSTGVQQCINAAVLDLLKYIAIFPGGVSKLTDQFGRVLPDCFFMPPASTAFDFAGKIHTDLQKNFVAAIDVKSKRKVGRDHQLHHCDVVEIMTR